MVKKEISKQKFIKMQKFRPFLDQPEKKICGIMDKAIVNLLFGRVQLFLQLGDTRLKFTDSSIEK